MRILIAEDDSETAEFIRRGLSELGHNVLVARDGPGALRLLLVEELDLAILDRMLPRLDGLSVVRRTRAGKVETPVLLLTALGRIQDRVDGLDAGADDYLVKPFAFSELAARVNALARRKPLQAQPTTHRTSRHPRRPVSSGKWNAMAVPFSCSRSSFESSKS